MEQVHLMFKCFYCKCSCIYNTIWLVQVREKYYLTTRSVHLPCVLANQIRE